LAKQVVAATADLQKINQAMSRQPDDTSCVGERRKLGQQLPSVRGTKSSAAVGKGTFGNQADYVPRLLHSE